MNFNSALVISFIEMLDILGLTPGEVQDRKISDTQVSIQFKL